MHQSYVKHLFMDESNHFVCGLGLKSYLKKKKVHAWSLYALDVRAKNGRELRQTGLTGTQNICENFI